jgi:putative ABC transport system permease protein
MPLKKVVQDMKITNYSEVKVRVDKKENIQTARSVVEKMGFGTSYLGDTITQITTIFTFFRYIIGGFGLISMLVAILGMFNTLTVSLLERTREIGVLKANNATKKDIFLMFLSEALIISFIGGLCGIISGIATGKLANFWFNFYAAKSGSTALVLFYAPTVFLVLVLAMVTVIGFLTGLYPATRATKIKILDALKYE